MSVAADDTSQFRQKGLNRYQPACDVFPDQRTVFVNQKIVATGKSSFVESPIPADDFHIGIADKAVPCAHLVSKFLLGGAEVSGNTNDLDAQGLKLVVIFTELGEFPGSAACKSRGEEREQHLALAPEFLEPKVRSPLPQRRGAVHARRLKLTHCSCSGDQHHDG